MSSVVEICNAALIHLGQETITSLTDDSKRARICNQRYEAIRDRSLRSHPWRFAIKRQSVAADVDTPTFNWSYQYTPPVECLRVLRIKDIHEPFIVESNKILTDQSGPLYLQFLRRVTNPNEFDPCFIELLALDIAIATCIVITNDRLLIRDVLIPLRTDALFEARSAGAMEGWPDEIFEEGTWVSVRD